LDSIKPKEKKIRKLKKKIKIFSSNVTPKNILPKKNWYLKFENYWKVSEKDSHDQLRKFLEDRVFKYGQDRDFPSLNGSSKISPYLRNGLINVNTVWSQCSKLKNKNISVRKYLNELGWREFSHSLINYFPEMLKGNLRKEFDKFPWEKNQKNLKAWKNGLTGYPIVDAGMRQMYETGWMHNRIRMVVGSFLVKHLRIDWKGR
jgi:Deoxyribodipyrimidine photolyase